MTDELMTTVTEEVFENAVEEALEAPAVEVTTDVAQAVAGTEAFIYMAIGAGLLAGGIGLYKLAKGVAIKTGICDKVKNAWDNRKVFKRKVKARTQTTYYVPDERNQQVVEEIR